MSAAGTERRARASGGESDEAIYRLVASQLAERAVPKGLLVDVGCGAGKLFGWVRDRVERYVGADLVRFDAFPSEVEFRTVDLDGGKLPFEEACADAVTCVETIEHVENPRALMRELSRIVRPGGWVLVTTPNQVSLASKLCLLFRDEFQHFQARPGLYPAHITALLPIDLVRIAEEVGLVELDVVYTGEGRVPLSTRRWPALIAAQRGLRASLLSDNVLLAARRPP